MRCHKFNMKISEEPELRKLLQTVKDLNFVTLNTLYLNTFMRPSGFYC